MRKFIFCLTSLFSLTFCCANAQNSIKTNLQTTTQSKNFHYFIILKGLKSKEQETSIEDNINLKKGVKYFLSRDNGKATFFELETTKAITKEEFSTWLNNPVYHISYFGSKTDGFEKAIMDASNQ